jgi:tetratricopeptide (TPR) repeat protein/tRNA A-37 threonylcarbamoyl transferase component Bud32
MIGKTISHYRILGQAGEGGMGVVYVAEDTVLGRRVAIKIPHAGHEESHYRARFLREARAVSKLRHRNIAAVHDFGETEDGQPFIVMELVSGQTLGDLLAGPGLSIARAVEVVRETAEALSEAHRCGVVHRDIKPSNVIIDERGEVKVLDFGLAKQLHEEFAGTAGSEATTLLSARTRSDVVIGTPLYLSPEQARGAKVDGRSDLFALGALLYECIAGRPAFSGANVIEIGAQVLHFDPPPPSRFNPRVPTELDRLTLKALSKRAEDRFQTADEFASELERVRLRLPDSDATRTRRLVTAENGHRSSALITMAETLRRPKFSPLTLGASLGALLLLIWLVTYLSGPSKHRPPAAAVTLYERGVDAMREGAYYKASGLLRQAVELDEKFALAHARLAETWTEMDFLDRAKDEMLATQVDPELLEREDALYLEAVRSTVMREYENAVKAYTKLVQLKPERPQAHLDLGRAYEKNNETEQAVKSYTEATTLDSSYAAAFLRLGVLQARQGNSAGATNAFEHAQKLYAASPSGQEGEAEVHYQRGRIFVSLKKPVEASAELNQALALARATDNKYQQVQALLQLSYVQDDGAQSQSLANTAINIAQTSGMNDLVTFGHITLGSHALARGDYDEAEREYGQALDLARNYKVRRLEALALAQRSSLRTKQSRPDEAEKDAAEAREFYLQGGYRKEADQCAMLVARSRRQKGEYEGALKIFEEYLRLAEQSGDMGQVGNLHRECGSVLYSWGKYAQALEHFRESANAARAIHSSTLLTYSLLNQASVLWPLGRYDDAADALAQVTSADMQKLGLGPDVLAFAYTTEADMALSRRHFTEADAKAKQALALLKDLKSPSKDLLAMINVDLGLSESFTRSRTRGRSLCQEAALMADQSGDPWTVSHAQMALAEALLIDGDSAAALAASLRAQEIFARTGRADSEWRALVLAGRASRRAGDETAAREYLARAAASLTQFEQSLDADASGYLSRSDVQQLRAELVGQTAAATR